MEHLGGFVSVGSFTANASNAPPPYAVVNDKPLDLKEQAMAYTSWHIQRMFNMPVSVPSRPKEVKLFRNNRSQAVRIPAEFELPGDRVLIHREGEKLIIEPVTKPSNIVELIAAWKTESPLGPEDEFSEIEDMPAKPENIF